MRKRDVAGNAEFDVPFAMSDPVGLVDDKLK
jgi:hypothetical protein